VDVIADADAIECCVVGDDKKEIDRPSRLPRQHQWPWMGGAQHIVDVVDEVGKWASVNKNINGHAAKSAPEAGAMER
jgi:hypothetical protein